MGDVRSSFLTLKSFAAVVLAVIVSTSVVVEGQEPTCAWRPGFVPRGLDGEVRAMVEFDDGTGPALYVGGDFTVAGDQVVNHVAKWDGKKWAPLGTGTDGPVHAFAMYDDGTGEALYVAGNFIRAGETATGAVAKWDGQAWERLDKDLVGQARALAVFDDGSGEGEALYVGGDFGGDDREVDFNYIGKWDGGDWKPLPKPGGGRETDVDGPVMALVVYNDGSGEALHIGGRFSGADGVSAENIVKWDGSAWSPLGSGTNDAVRALALHNDANGPALYAGGSFTVAGGVSARRVARWNGSEWTALGDGVNGTVLALSVYDDSSGSGAALHVGGSLGIGGDPGAINIAKWDGHTWAGLDLGVNQPVSALAVFDDGQGDALFVGGRFGIAGTVFADGIAKWDGMAWARLADPGFGTLNGPVHALIEHDDGHGRALFVGGSFTVAGDVSASHVAKWNGTAWEPLGPGLNGTVRTLAVFEGALYAGGSFTAAGQEPMGRVAKWNGTHWEPLGSGLNGEVWTATVFDDGRGPALYVGGDFITAGGFRASRIAQWNGSRWDELGTGLNGRVKALAVYNDGSGPALYVGGEFTTAGGTATDYIAKWEGITWVTLDEDLRGPVHALIAHDDGSDKSDGTVLYAGGADLLDDRNSLGMARWLEDRRESRFWDDVDQLPSAVNALALHDDGAGLALYAGGSFIEGNEKDGIRRIAKWHGRSWSPLGPGLNGQVHAMAVHEDERGPALYVGGEFSAAGDVVSTYLAKWECSTFPDLEITKTNHASEVLTGGETTYTITVRNLSLIDVSNAVLEDALPALLTCSWESEAEGGAFGHSNGSGPLLRDDLDLPAGSSVIYTMTCQLDPDVTGELINTATISHPEDLRLDNNSATDSDPIVRESDLEITLTNGTDQVVAGGSAVYHVAAFNHGPGDAGGISLDIELPAGLEACHWQSDAKHGASGPSSGSGNLVADSLQMPAGSSVRYLVSCAVSQAEAPQLGVGHLRAQASIIHGSGATSDPNPENNVVIDEDEWIERPNAETVIFTHLLRMQNEMGLILSEAPALLAKLHEFAAHPSVQGLVVDVGSTASLAPLYAAWDVDVANPEPKPELANEILFSAGGLHDLLLQKLEDHPGVIHLMLVGDDRIFPLTRVKDFTRSPSEEDYTPRDSSRFIPGLTADGTTVGQAAARNFYLSDDPIAKREPIKPDKLHQFGKAILPDLAVGRLVETPNEILRSLELFLERDGQLDLTELDPERHVLVTGYDFLVDSSKRIRQRWKNVFNEPRPHDASDLTPVDGELVSRNWGLPDADSREDALLDRLARSHAILSLNGHATHYEEGVPGQGPRDIQGLDATEIDNLDFEGSVIYAVGCHGGLPVAGNRMILADHPLDLPQTFLRRGVLAYVANSGFGWGLLHGVGYSERLVEIFTEELSRGGIVQIGEAVTTAKQRYFFEDSRFDRYDVKTTMQWTLFGFPMLEIRTGIEKHRAAEPAKASVEISKLTSFGGEPLPRHLESELRVSNLSAPGRFVKHTAEGSVVPPEESGCPDEIGCYYALDGLASGEGDLPIEPVAIEESRQAGTSQHGVLWKGGAYDEENGWAPLFAQPISNGDALEIPGSLPRKTFIRPRSGRRPGAFAETSDCRPTDTEPNTLVFTPSELLFDENLEPTIHRLHRLVELEVFYYNNTVDGTGNCDRTGPSFDEDAILHSVTGSRVRWTVPVEDEGGVWRVVVVWDDEINDRWVPLELAHDASTERWRGELTLPSGMDRLTYFLQAVDNRGNVSWLDFVPKVESQSGIEPQVPLLLEAEAVPPPPPSDPIFLDGFETGDCSRWLRCPQ